MKNVLCGICTNEVEHFGYLAYGCELCPQWIHAECLFPKASNSELKILFKYNSGYDVKCLSCKQETKVQMFKELAEMRDQLTSYSKSLDNFKNGLQLQPNLEKSVEEMKKSNADIAKQHSQGLLKEAKVSSEKVIKKEFAAMEKRRTAKEESLCNIVLSGIPENASGSLTSKVLSICTNLEPRFLDGDLLSCRRLGKRNSDRQHARLVLGKMRLSYDAQYFHRYGKGRCINIDGMGDIWINPDLSKAEREARYKARMSRRNKKDNSQITGAEANMNHPPAAAFDDAVNDNRTNEADMTTEEISGDNNERVCDTKKDHVDDFGRDEVSAPKNLPTARTD